MLNGLYNRVRDLLTYLPQSNREPAPTVECDDPVDREDEAIDRIIPSDSAIAYDMKEIVARVGLLLFVFLHTN